MSETVSSLIPVILFISFLIIPAFVVLITRDYFDPERRRKGKPLFSRPRLDLTDTIAMLKVNPIFYFYVGGTAYFFDKDEAGLVLIIFGIILAFFRITKFLKKKLRLRFSR